LPPKRYGYGTYKIGYDIINRFMVFSYTYNPYRTGVFHSTLPLQHLSDVAYLQWKELCEDSDPSLCMSDSAIIPVPNAVFISGIVNSRKAFLTSMAICSSPRETNDTEEEIVDKLDENLNWVRITFTPMQDEYMALLDSPSKHSVCYLLAQHKKRFGLKQVVAIHVAISKILRGLYMVFWIGHAPVT
jgi:hypothetical protein